MRFDNRICIVTGGGQGLGRSIAHRLAAEGGTVVVVDQNAAAARSVVEELVAGEHIAITADVSRTSDIEDAFSAVEKTFGALDVLVNCAGIIRDNRVENISDNDWDAVIGVSLGGTFRCARSAFPIMKRQGFGRIVSFASMSWHGNFGQANYVAAKAGIVGLTRTLALEGARDGITANAVSPGLMETPMLASMNASAREKLISKIPMRHTGTPEDIAEGVAFLASPRAGYISGVVLDIDGGISIGSSIR